VRLFPLLGTSEGLHGLASNRGGRNSFWELGPLIKNTELCNAFEEIFSKGAQKFPPFFKKASPPFERVLYLGPPAFEISYTKAPAEPSLQKGGVYQPGGNLFFLRSAPPPSAKKKTDGCFHEGQHKSCGGGMFLSAETLLYSPRLGRRKTFFPQREEYNPRRWV